MIIKRGSQSSGTHLARVVRFRSFQADGGAFKCGNKAPAAKQYTAAVSSRGMVLHRQCGPASTNSPLTARLPPLGAAISNLLTTVWRPAQQGCPHLESRVLSRESLPAHLLEMSQAIYAGVCLEPRRCSDSYLAVIHTLKQTPYRRVPVSTSFLGG